MARVSSQLPSPHGLREGVKTMKPAMRAAAAAVLAAALYAGTAFATTVFVMSIGSNKVQVLINDSAVRTLMEGDTRIATDRKINPTTERKPRRRSRPAVDATRYRRA